MRPARIFLCLFAMVLVIQSFIIPPLQSPDETDHLKRAWLLLRGQWFLTQPATGAPSSSGGEIDTGLIEYLRIHSRIHHKPSARLTAGEVAEASKLRWSNATEFSPAPGTGYYFPLIYLPQALALMTGKVLDFSIHGSYWLARRVNLLVAILILDLAFAIWAPNSLVLGILMLPMMMFQINSTSIDGTLVALVMLVASCFIAAFRSRGPVNRGHALVISLVVPLLICAHQNLFPLVIFPAALAISRKSAKWGMVTLTSLVLGFIWAMAAVEHTVDLRIPQAQPGSAKIMFYAGHPDIVLRMIANTIIDPEKVSIYWKSWIGLLGWWDTYLSPAVYDVSPWFIAGIGGIAFNRVKIRQHQLEVNLFVMIALGMVILTFLAMIFGWTPIGAHKVSGVQGRYFIIPSLMFALALQGWPPGRDLRSRMALFLLVAWGVVSSVGGSMAVFERYHG